MKSAGKTHNSKPFAFNRRGALLGLFGSVAAGASVFGLAPSVWARSFFRFPVSSADTFVRRADFQLVNAAHSSTLPSPDWSKLEAGPRVEITDVVDGDTVELRRGPDVRLVGIQAPKLPLGRDHVVEWPLARESKTYLQDVIGSAGRDAQLFFGGRERDRHGRYLAHIVMEDGTWLQGAMILAGLARVYTFSDNRSLIPDLLLREAVARQGQAFMWSHPDYAIRDARDPSSLLNRVNSFELVEGVVRNVDAHRGRWYLNFGQTWREDFTITIDRDADPMFENANLDLHTLKGTAVRVRGWVSEDGGPLIRIDHPEAIERLTGAS
ncbi:MAG: thermonuclease family protein [Pseudomonadota bacterium]